MTVDDGGTAAPVARVLVVCTANICRSPLAEELLRAYVARVAPEAPLVFGSAGTVARPGDAAAPGMQDVAAGWGLDLSLHRSRRVDPPMALEHDLVLTMERRHRSNVSRLAPGVAARAFTFVEFASVLEVPPAPVVEDAAPGDGQAPVSDDWPPAPELLDEDHPGRLLREAVAAWHRTRVRAAVPTDDVDDPYGGPQEGYVATGWELAGLVERIAPALVEAVVTRP